MPTPFVPLSASAPASARVDLGSQPFRPTQVVPIQQQPASPAAANPAPPTVLHAHAHPASGAPPVVSVKRDGDRIVEIHIQCGCGQEIHLECDYSVI